MAKTDTILRECSQCRKQVVISYECPKCQLLVCMICAIENDWKCPKCKVDVIWRLLGLCFSSFCRWFVDNYSQCRYVGISNIYDWTIVIFTVIPALSALPHERFSTLWTINHANHKLVFYPSIWVLIFHLQMILPESPCQSDEVLRRESVTHIKPWMNNSLLTT